MNIDTSFLLQTLLPITRILLAITVIGFSYSAIAGDVVTDDQIRRVAKIARATKTNITITKERVTVTVHGGSSKKMPKRVKKTVSQIMKQRNYVPKQMRYSDDAPDLLRPVPLLNDTEFRPPAVINNSRNRPAPVLNNRQPPALNTSGAENSGFY